MKHFLVVYDRSRSELVSCTEFDDGREAMMGRFALEREHPPGTPLEIVVLSAQSLDGVHRTHARYFRSTVELVGDLKARLTSVV